MLDKKKFTDCKYEVLFECILFIYNVQCKIRVKHCCVPFIKDLGGLREIWNTLQRKKN